MSDSDEPRTYTCTGRDACPTPSGEYGVQLYRPPSSVDTDRNSSDPRLSVDSRAPSPPAEPFGTSGATTRSSLDHTTLVTGGLAVTGHSRRAGRPRASRTSAGSLDTRGRSGTQPHNTTHPHSFVCFSSAKKSTHNTIEYTARILCI